jgi:tetratricopeptide (TPR) repeat protein
MDPQRDESRVGTLLDQRYRILRQIGRGGSGVVFEARHEEMARHVAIKVLRSDLFLSPDAFDRFRREARAAGRLRHANVVIVFDFGRTSEGEAFLVMEHCEGGSLADLPRRGGQLDLRDIARIFRGVGAAVGAAHRAGIVHRDLKPANILFAGDVPKVADFGLARMLEDDDAQLTGAHAIGSPAYMSPEQCAGNQADERSDVYSLGVVLYEAVTGRLPFAGPTIQATLMAHLTATATDPAQLRTDLPPAARQVLVAALSRDPGGRPATPEELTDGFAAAIEPRPAGRGNTPRIRRTSTSLPIVPVGRQAELSRLVNQFEGARAGRGALVTIAGEPGLGKTTLVNAFLDQVHAAFPEVLTAVGRCSEYFGSTEAYLPFLDALGSLLAGGERARAERVIRSFAPSWAGHLPVLAPSGPPSLPDGSARLRDRMPRELADALLALVSETPMVLVLEDLHWADAASIDLLGYLAPRLARWRLLVVVTYRPEDVAVSGHPLRHVMRKLVPPGAAGEIIPRQFGHAEIALYLQRELQATAPPELLAFLARATEGNPLFVVNTVNHLLQTGAVLRVQDDLVLLSPLAELEEAVPKGLMGVIEEKIERLSEEDRRLLQAASVQGDTFEAAVVARLLASDELAVEERLGQVARAHRLVEPVGEIDFPTGSTSTRFRFVHSLYQNALYASLLGRRRAVWHGEVAAALVALYGRYRDPVLVPLAVHYERARDLDRAIDTNIAAAEVVARGNPRDARPLLEKALEMAARLDGEARSARRAELLIRLGRHDAETAELVGDVALYDRAERAVSEALELVPGSAEARTILGLVHLERGQNEEAFADFERVIQESPRHGPAWDGLSYLFKNTGLWPEALTACDRAAALDSRFAHSIRRLSTLIFEGRIGEALVEANALVALRPRFSHYNYWKGIVEFYVGDITSCRAWVERGYEFDTEDQIGQGVLAFVLAWQGETARARELLTAAEQGAGADGTFTYWIANVYAVLGETRQAVAWIRRAVELGYWNAPWIAKDSAIDSLRGDPQFEACLAAVTERQREFAEAVRPRWAALLAVGS